MSNSILPKKLTTYSSNNKAFTILELLIVIGVLSVIIGIAIPRIKGMQEQGNVAKVKEELKTMKAALESYYAFLTPSAYPPTSSSVGASYLTQGAPRILSSVLYDPFAVGGTEYNYKLSSNGKYYVTYSKGLNKSAGTIVIGTSGYVTGKDSDDLCQSNGIGCDEKLPVGVTCAINLDCQTGVCGGAIPPICLATGSAPSNAPCASGSDCQSGYCHTLAVACTPGGPWNACSDNAGCQSGNCSGGVCQP